MTFMERFANGLPPGTVGDEGADPTSANRANAYLSLQVLLDRDTFPSADALRTALGRFDPKLAHATVEIEPESAAHGMPLGIVSWDDHAVHVVGINAPAPAGVLDVTVDVSPFSDEFRTTARHHVGHVLLLYAGEGADLLGQYVALAAVAAAWTEYGAVAVLNEAARAAVPAGLLRIDSTSPALDRTAGPLDVLRGLPLLLLYCGFVRFEVPGFTGVWMRTFGCGRLGQPDLATFASAHEQNDSVFELFSQLLKHLRTSGTVLRDGDTTEMEGDTYLRVRAPAATETFLDPTPGSVFVVELIGPNADGDGLLNAGA